MRILVLKPALYDTAPGDRFRIEQWARQIQKTGVEFVFEPFMDEELHRIIYKPGQSRRKIDLVLRSLARRVKVVLGARQFDLVFIFREAALVGPAIFERLVALLGVPYIYDFDDAVWVPTISEAHKQLQWVKFPGKTASECRLASLVFAGNPYLAEYAKRYNSNVAIIPTTIDLDIYTLQPPAREDDVPTVGWTGSFSTVQHLDTLRPAFSRLGQAERFRLLAVGTGTTDYSVPGIETIALPWTASTEVDNIRRMDIGVMPLPDNQFTRGKCGLKMLQYMALGIPSVASSVGVNSEIVQNGVNGFLASSEDEWVEKLTLLLRDPDLRHRIGMAGRRTVEEYYSAQFWAPRIRRMMEATAARERASVDAGNA